MNYGFIIFIPITILFVNTVDEDLVNMRQNERTILTVVERVQLKND